MNWYYVDAGRQSGPIAEPEFNRLVQTGAVQPHTLVWREGMTAWQPLNSLDPASAPTILPDGAGRLCCKCGKTVPPTELIRFAELEICAACKPVFFQQLKEGDPWVLPTVYGGFWLRATARLVDTLVLSVCTSLIQLGVDFLLANRLHPSAGTASAALDSFELFLLQVVLSISVSLGYHVWFLGRFGATPGKMACGLKVVRADGQPITYLRALARVMGDWLSGIVFGIGYLMVAVDGQKRALHDHICDTRVLRERD